MVPHALTVLGIPVSEAQVRRWLTYWAPVKRPYPATELPAALVEQHRSELLAHPDEWRDTFFLYGPGPWVWLAEAEFTSLAAELRTRLADGMRRRTAPKPVPAWPSDPLVVARMVRWMEAGTRSSLHALAAADLRRASQGVLPGAMEVAGTFARGSGPNCFAAVMAAAGEPVSESWVQVDEFSTWLASHAVPVRRGGSPDAPGRVLVWHERGSPAHAAVTIGGGWALQKPSQSWSSPTVVQPVSEVIRSWTYPGTRVHTYELLEDPR